MVQKEINFSDGTRIFYEDVNGNPQRFIQYSYTPEEREKIEKNPIIKDAIDSKKKRHNAGKYYYLEILRLKSATIIQYTIKGRFMSR